MIGIRIKIDPIISTKTKKYDLLKLQEVSRHMETDVDILFSGYSSGVYRIGKRLKGLMKSKSIDKGKLSEKAKLSEGLIDRILSDKTVCLSNDLVENIAFVLDVPVKELIACSFEEREIPSYEIASRVEECIDNLIILIKSKKLRLIRLIMDEYDE